MAEVTINANGNPLNTTVSWNITDIINTPFSIEITRTLNDTPTVIYNKNEVESLTGSIVDSETRDLSAPDPMGIEYTDISFINSTKNLNYKWKKPDSDIGTLYVYSIKVTDSEGNVISNTTNYEAIGEIKEFATKVDKNQDTELTLSDSVGNVDKYNKILEDDQSVYYIHTASIDSYDNIGETLHTAVDVAPPTEIGDVKINGQVLDSSKISSIFYDPSGFTLDISPSTQTRGMEIFYDISLTVAGKTLIEANKTKISTGYSYNGNILSEIPNINNSVQFLVKVKSYTIIGSSLGIKQFLFTLNRDSVKYEIDFSKSNNINPIILENPSINTVIGLQWDKISSDVEISQYNIYYRNKKREDIGWSEWIEIGSTETTSFDINTSNLVKTGSSLYMFSIRGVESDGTILSMKSFDKIFAEMMVIKAKNSERFTILASLPIEALNGFTIKGKSNITSENTYESDIISINGNDILSKIGNNKSSVFPSFTTSGYDLTNAQERNSFEEGLISSLEDYRSTSDYIGEVKDIKYTYNGDSHYYVVLVDIPNTDPLLGTIEYVYDGLLGKSTLGETSIIFNEEKKIVSTSYEIIKFKELFRPQLGITGNPDPVSTEGGISIYNPPISITSLINSKNEDVKDSLKIITSYDYSSGDDSGTVNDYTNGTKLNTPASYTFYSKVRYTYEVDENNSIIKESDESSLSFVINDVSGDFISPSLTTEFISNDEGTKLIINTNTTNISNYIYKIYNTDTKEIYNGYTISTDDNGIYILTITFNEVGEYNISVDYILNINGEIVQSDTISTQVVVYKYSEPTGKIVGLTPKDSILEDKNPKSNNYTMSTNGLLSKNNLYLLEYDGGKYLIKEKYNVPLLFSSSFKLGKYSINPNSRNKLVSLDGKNSSLNITTPSTTIVNTDNQSSDLTTIDPDTIPASDPQIGMNSDNTISGNDEEGYSVFENISFNIRNNSSDYLSKIFIDGNVYTEGSVFNKSGKHIFLAIFYNKHNFTIRTKKFNFEILNNFSINIPFIDYEPKFYQVEEYTVTIKDEFDCLPEGSEDIPVIQYKDSINNTWINYNGPFKVNKPCTITAKKTYPISNRILTSEFIFTEEMLTRIKPPAPVIREIENEIPYIKIPTVEKITGIDYEFKINNLPYRELTPLTNSTPLVRKFTLEVTATDKRNGLSSKSSKEFIIDTTVSDKPILDGLDKTKNIMKIDPSLKARIINKDSRTEYKIIVDDRIVEEGNNLFNPINMNGDHQVIIIGIRDNLTTTSNFYSININNYSTTDSMYSNPVNKRTSLIPLNSDSASFDTTGELVVDTRTADISFVDEDLKLKEITKELRDKVNSLDYNLGKVSKSNRYLDQANKNISGLIEINTNNDTNIVKPLISKIRSEVDPFVSKMNVLINSINTTKDESEILKNNIDSLVNSFNTNKGKYNDIRLQNKRNESINILRDASKKFIKNMSDISNSNYNLETINLIANKKVLTNTFNQFRDKNNKILNDITNVIKRF